MRASRTSTQPRIFLRQTINEPSGWQLSLIKMFFAFRIPPPPSPPGPKFPGWTNTNVFSSSLQYWHSVLARKPSFLTLRAKLPLTWHLAVFNLQKCSPRSIAAAQGPPADSGRWMITWQGASWMLGLPLATWKSRTKTILGLASRASQAAIPQPLLIVIRAAGVGMVRARPFRAHLGSHWKHGIRTEKRVHRVNSKARHGRAATWETNRVGL